MKELFQLLYGTDAKRQKTLGYKPPLLMRIVRFCADVIVFLFRLNSNSPRLSVEIQQKISPYYVSDLPNGSSLKLATGHGRLLWRAKTYLEEEPALINWIDTFTSDDVFYDIGANVGSYSLYAAKTTGAKVYSFEPELNNAQVLYKNVYLNSLFNLITPVTIACDEKTSVQDFHMKQFSPGDAMHTIGRKAFYLEACETNSEMQSFTCRTFCMALDDIIEKFCLLKPTRVKLDVDTNELRVVKGMLKTLQDVREIYIELDSSFDEHNEVFSIMEEFGFSVSKKEPVERVFNLAMNNYLFVKE